MLGLIISCWHKGMRWTLWEWKFARRHLHLRVQAITIELSRMRR
jgi:hypothetical protein